MVSVQTSACYFPTTVDGSSRKRKRDHHGGGGGGEFMSATSKELKLLCKSTSSNEPPKPAADDIELHLEDSPLPPEWQRCLDINSGKIHFYNTRTRNRTTRDPRRQSPPPTTRHVSLDLDLNLGICEKEEEIGGRRGLSCDLNEVVGTMSAPAALEEEEDSSSREMVATVCMRCHMLVMMWRSSPSCPNCKFLHPILEGEKEEKLQGLKPSPTLLQATGSFLSLPCCKD